MKKEIGKTIRTYRKKNGYTQEMLAEHLGKTAGYIGQIERDEIYPSLPSLLDIIDFLNIDINLFFNNQSKCNNETLLLNEISIRASKLSMEKQEFLLAFIGLLEKNNL